MKAEEKIVAFMFFSVVMQFVPSGHFNVESTLNQRQTSTLKQR